MAERGDEREIPKYIEQAVFRLADDPDLIAKISELMPDAAFRVGAGFVNAYHERQNKKAAELNRMEATDGKQS